MSCILSQRALCACTPYKNGLIFVPWVRNTLQGYLESRKRAFRIQKGSILKLNDDPHRPSRIAQINIIISRDVFPEPAALPLLSCTAESRAAPAYIFIARPSPLIFSPVAAAVHSSEWQPARKGSVYQYAQHIFCIRKQPRQSKPFTHSSQ